jgi:DNA-binding response OmpR family regulator
VHVANVRRKLREHGEVRWIRTVRGVGFRFDAA